MAAKKTSKDIIHTVGRRKTSVARSSMQKGKGVMRINGQNLEEVVKNPILQLRVIEPLILTDMQSNVDISIKLQGGGFNSQVDALRQAIARGLIEMLGEETKKMFSEYDRTLVVTDTRFKETKKPNNSHARAKRQKSYR